MRLPLLFAAMLANGLASGTQFVTGAAGFIGSHLVDRLLMLGFRVAGADNMILGRRANLAAALRQPNFSFREVDLNDYSACLDFLRSEHEQNPMGTIWHLAANSDIQAGGKDPDVDLNLTFMTTYNVLKMMSALKVPRIV